MSKEENSKEQEKMSIRTLEEIEKELEASPSSGKKKKKTEQKEEKDIVSHKIGEEKPLKRSSSVNAGTSTLQQKLEEITQPHSKDLREKLITQLKNELEPKEINTEHLDKMTQPFMKIPPKNETQRRIWKEDWSKALLILARKKVEFVFDLKNLLQQHPFHNIRLKNLRIIVEWLKEEELARWLNSSRTTMVIFWKTREEIAEEIYETALAIGVPFLGLRDIQKVYKLPRRDLREIIDILEEKTNSKSAHNTIFFSKNAYKNR